MRRGVTRRVALNLSHSSVVAEDLVAECVEVSYALEALLEEVFIAFGGFLANSLQFCRLVLLVDD